MQPLLRFYAFGALFLFFSISSSAQNSDFNAFQSRNAFHLELGGKAWSWSLNYERRYIPREDLHWSWQFGVSKRTGSTWTQDPDIDRDLLIPISVHLMYGQSRHQLELGLGTTLKTINGFSNGNVSSPTIENGFWMMGVGQIGYRYHPKVYGPVIRVFYSPIYQYLNVHQPGQQNFYHWFGISIGWALKHAYVG